MIIEIDRDIAPRSEPFHPSIPEIGGQECEHTHDGNPWENAYTDIGRNAQVQCNDCHDSNHARPSIEYWEYEEYGCDDLDEHASPGDPLHGTEMLVHPVPHAGPE